MTRFASFSLTLPLLHFFFLDLPPAMAAFILASLDFWTTLLAPMVAKKQQPTTSSLMEPCHQNGL